MANIYATHKPESGSDSGGLYLKLKDGEVAKIRIATEPAIFESESKPDENNNTRISTRYAWTVYTKEITPAGQGATPHPVNQAQVFQQSATFFKQLAGFAQDDDYGDPTSYDIKVRREGEGLETTYQITPSPKKEPLGVKEMEAVKNIDLLAKLEASPFSQRVAWLSDFDNSSKPAEKPNAGPNTDEQAKIRDEFGNEEISLENIPF